MKTKKFIPVLLTLSAIPALASAQEEVDTTSITSIATDTPYFLWWEGEHALRIGRVTDSSFWDNPGDFSVAIGEDAQAPGSYSFVFGDSASGGNSSFVFGGGASGGSHGIAMGLSASANFLGTIAIGTAASAESWWDVAVGGSAKAGGGYSVALGNNAEALTGAFGVAVGYDSVASSGQASAIGAYSSAVGLRSSAFGTDAMAVGDHAVAMGALSLASGFGGVALGYGNESKRKDGSTPDPENPDDLDPVLMVGNATASDMSDDNNRSNAMTVYRDGDAHFDGAVRVKPQGDLSMGQFTSTPAGVQFP